MNKYLIGIEVQDGEIEKIMEELQRAQETICTCYNRLVELGVVTIKKAAPTLETQERQGDINPDKLRKSEILSLARLFHVSINTATEYRDILATQVKQSDVEMK